MLFKAAVQKLFLLPKAAAPQSCFPKLLPKLFPKAAPQSGSRQLLPKVPPQSSTPKLLYFKYTPQSGSPPK